MSLLPELDLHPCLRARVHRRCPAGGDPAGGDDPAAAAGFVAYLPTVCLRREQNPAFAVACHAANRLGVPLVVLAVVLDDASHGAVPARRPHRRPPARDGGASDPASPAVVATSRRLAFTLQALAHASAEWSAHGAAVGVRVHGPRGGARTPDHLTLASRAALVVTDEPFVAPFATLAMRVEAACRKAGVECWRVDGSCTVPPLQVLTPTRSDAGAVRFQGVPGKAYLWQKKTEHLREGHLRAAMDGAFAAPALTVRLEDDALCDPDHPLAARLPSRWKAQAPSSDDAAAGSPDGGAPPGAEAALLPSAPDVRPFASRELAHLYEHDDYVPGETVRRRQRTPAPQPSGAPATGRNPRPFHKFATSWPGADAAVPPCPQTIGTTPQGLARWNDFVGRGGLKRYGAQRSDARSVRAVSRMSAYLNLGIVPIFRLVWEVKRAQERQKGDGRGTTPGRWKSGADKFEEEIVKWREMSYAHAFSRDDYDAVGSLPPWSVSCLDNYAGGRSRHTLQQLASGTTGDAKWDAMQQYLVRTGELHNNVRMTWGKTVVEWLGCADAREPNGAADATLRTLCYLNDRFALDGLSPPSYAGLLWCMGWTDKPSGKGAWNIAKKPARLYRMNPEAFQGAARLLLASRSGDQEVRAESSGDAATGMTGLRRQRSVLDMLKMQVSETAHTISPTGDISSRGDDKKRPEKNTVDSKSPSSSKAMKRNGSFTIGGFFSENPSKKAARGKSKQIIG